MDGSMKLGFFFLAIVVLCFTMKTIYIYMQRERKKETEKWILIWWIERKKLNK